jgi:tRNA (mo5U34)-methyltransferase
MSVYSLDPDELGTFDLVMFFGLLYHLEYPLLGVEKVAAMMRKTLLMQSYSMVMPGREELPLARFQPDGIWSGPPENPIHDPTVLWEPNAACVKGMLQHVGLVNIEQLQGAPTGRRQAIVRRLRPKSPWNTSIQFRAEKAD